MPGVWPLAVTERTPGSTSSPGLNGFSRPAAAYGATASRAILKKGCMSFGLDAATTSLSQKSASGAAT